MSLINKIRALVVGRPARAVDPLAAVRHVARPAGRLPSVGSLTAQHSPSRLPWVLPVDDSLAGGYGGGGPVPEPVAEPDEPVVVEDLPLPVEVQPLLLPKSAEPGFGPTFVDDDPPAPRAFRRLSLQDDRPELSNLGFVPPIRLSGSDERATDTAPYVGGWAPESRQGIAEYPDWRSGR